MQYALILLFSLWLIACENNIPEPTAAVMQDKSETLVVGYLPGYRGLVSHLEHIGLEQLTHLNLSFANPDATGELINNDKLLCMAGKSTANVSGDEIRIVVERAHQVDVKVLMSVGGGIIPQCSGDWHNLLQTDNRQNLVTKLIHLVDEFKLDGLDIDLEGILLTQIDNAGNYTPFIQALSVELKKRKKLLTTATASYVGGMVPVSSIAYFDLVNIMSYDAIGPSWGPSGTEHASYQQAEEHLLLWRQRGVDKNKLVLGLPFYGYGFGSYAGEHSFKDILTKFGQQAANKDVVGNACASCSYVTYNGLTTIRAKTALALQHGGGVMIWELTQDASGNNSLLNTISQQIQATQSQP